MLARGGIIFGESWTASEDRLLAEHYVDGIRAASTALGGHRSDHSIRRRAHRLGLARKRHWTAAEDKMLTFIWEEGIRIDAMAKRMERTPSAIYRRGQDLGLKLGVPDGYEYVTAAARRVGFSIETMFKMLRAAGIQLRITHSDPTVAGKGKADWRRRYVDPEEVDCVVNAWNLTEYVGSAAKARGIAPNTLRRWLKISGVLPLGPPKTFQRVASEVIDRVIAARRAGEPFIVPLAAEPVLRAPKAKGATWNKRLKKWQAQRRVAGRVEYLGLFDTEKEAADAFDAAAAQRRAA